MWLWMWDSIGANDVGACSEAAKELAGAFGSQQFLRYSIIGILFWRLPVVVWIVGFATTSLSTLPSLGPDFLFCLVALGSY